MAYSFAQYQADRALLGYKSRLAAPVPTALAMKLDFALGQAEPADHAAYQAAHDRLLAVAVALAAGNVEALPQPPADPPKPAKNSGRTGTRTAKRSDADRPAEQPAGQGNEEAEWQAALLARADRHARRRWNWPAVKPPFKEESSPGA